MRVLSHKQQLSFAALLLTVATFAVAPPDLFCRTQAGNRSRASRTVRLDDHDHDFSPELHPDDHISSDHAGLILIPEVPARLTALLTFAGTVEAQQTPNPVRTTLRTSRTRGPPAAV